MTRQTVLRARASKARMRTLLLISIATLMLGCGAAAPTPTTPATAHAAPRSLDEALAAAGLTRVELTQRSRQMTHALPEAPTVEGRALRMIETGGWNGSPSIFARRSDGTLVRVLPRVHEVVDRRVPGGCLTFAGGRGWFESVEYELPEGAAYGGDVDVSYEHHTEVVDHATTQADGSPCPPPARD